MCLARKIPIRYEHLDLSNPRPCFRALNNLACLLNASKRNQKGISLEEMMTRIEAKLSDYQGYLILFIDEVDNERCFSRKLKKAFTGYFHAPRFSIAHNLFLSCHFEFL